MLRQHKIMTYIIKNVVVFNLMFIPKKMPYIKEIYHDMLKKAMFLLTKLPCSTKNKKCHALYNKNAMLFKIKVPYL